jgi:hypothetical protein
MRACLDAIEELIRPEPAYGNAAEELRKRVLTEPKEDSIELH